MSEAENEEDDFYNVSESHYRIMADGDRIFKRFIYILIGTAGVFACSLFIYLAIK